MAVTAETEGAASVRKACNLAIGFDASQWQTLVSYPYGALLSRHKGKVMFFCRWKSERSKRGTPEEVEPGVCSDPNATLSIDKHFPCGVRTKSLRGCKALAGICHLLEQF